jgi:uncharacterized protein
VKRIYIFPRYSGDENSDWYQKAKKELMLRDAQTLVIPLSFPNWDKPEIPEFLSFVEHAIPLNELDETTYFVGHSVGCRAVLRFLNEMLKKKQSLKIGGLMFVAGWWTIDNAWSQLEQWINFTADYPKIREMCNGNVITLLSDNDPYTYDYRQNKKHWEEKLKADVLVIPGAKHFNNEGHEEVIRNLFLLISKPGNSY